MDFLHGVPHWQKSVRLKDTCGCRLSASMSGICHPQLVKGFSRRPTTRETMHARMSLAHHLHHMLPIRTLMTSDGRRSSKPATCALSRSGRSSWHIAGLRKRRANEAGQNDDNPLGLNPAEDGAPQSGRGEIVVEPESDVDGNDIVAQAAQGLSEAPGAGKELETEARSQRALGGGGRKGSRCRKNTCSSIVSDSSPNLISWAPHKLCW